MIVKKNKEEEEKEEEASRFALAHLRSKLIQPGAHGRCPNTIVIVGYT